MKKEEKEGKRKDDDESGWTEVTSGPPSVPVVRFVLVIYLIILALWLT